MLPAHHFMYKEHIVVNTPLSRQPKALSSSRAYLRLHPSALVNTMMRWKCPEKPATQQNLISVTALSFSQVLLCLLNDIRRLYSTGESRKPHQLRCYSFQFSICLSSAVTGRYRLMQFLCWSKYIIREPSPAFHWLLQLVLTDNLVRLSVKFSVPSVLQIFFPTPTDGSFLSIYLRKRK